MRLLVALLTASALLAGCSGSPSDGKDAGSVADGRGDAVVVAVVDGGFDPYHVDFLASRMPQALNDDPSDDLPLDQDPALWLPGHPGAAAFGSYGPLTLTLSEDEKAVPQKLHDADQKAWETVKTSTPDKVDLRWIPGTKVIGFVDFGGGGDGFSPNSHGVGTSSVSVGNVHGACPECLFVFVHGTSEQANRWVESQSWIDLQTNSWGISTIPSPVGIPRDRVYTGSDTGSQRAAVERGQQIFFSAGNGLANDFSAPNPTLLSSQEGPDWIVTVGAVTPGDQQSAYSGAGKPADVANIGSAYPSAGGDTIADGSTFGGTSNATPVTAGQYARALYELRRLSEGASRIQAGGVIVRGGGIEVTVHGLRAALFGAAADPNGAISTNGNDVPSPSPETTFAAFGHGVLTGRLNGDAALEAETQRIVDLALGADPKMPADETAWFVADSYCRQGIWGAWESGDYHTGVSLPAPDPQWPTRTYYANGCPESLGMVKDAIAALPL